MSRFDRFRSSNNPLLKEDKLAPTYNATLDGDMTGAGYPAMTVNGAVNKTLILSGIMLLAAVVGYTFANPIFLFGGAIVGLILVLVASFKPQHSPIIAPVYAGFEGLFVGSISAIYGSMFGGVVFQAVTLTMAVLFLMLFLYKSGIIKVTQKLRSGILVATGAIALVYLVSIVLSFFGINIPYLHEASPIGIVISLVIIAVAALNLLLDFDNIDRGAAMGAPQYMEWFCGMGLLVTLVWLNIEILRLVSMFAGED